MSIIPKHTFFVIRRKSDGYLFYGDRYMGQFHYDGQCSIWRHKPAVKTLITKLSRDFTEGVYNANCPELIAFITGDYEIVEYELKEKI